MTKQVWTPDFSKSDKPVGKIFNPRFMRNENRKMGQKIKNEMRTNLTYLIKPRPRYIPKKIWVWILKRILNLPNK